MPGLSNDQTALSVNRFIAQRQTLTSRPETIEHRRAAGAPVPLEFLHPSLYAEHSSLAQLCGDYFRAFVLTLGNRHSPSATHTS